MQEHTQERKGKKRAKRVILCTACLCGRVKDPPATEQGQNHSSPLYSLQAVALRPARKGKPVSEGAEKELETLNSVFGSAMPPWANCFCLSALLPSHKRGQCPFAQLHPGFIRGRAGLGRGCVAGTARAYSCPLGQPRLFLGRDQTSIGPAVPPPPCCSRCKSAPC